VESVDHGKQTYDCGMHVSFDQTNHANPRDANLIGHLDYVDTI
jgi:hypothetical protein